MEPSPVPGSCGGCGSAPNQDELGRRTEMLHPEAGEAIRSHPDQIADTQLLVLLRNPIEAVYVAAHQVLQPVETIEAGAALPDLHQPRPYRFDRRVDRDGAGVAEPGTTHEVVTGHRARRLGGRGKRAKLAVTTVYIPGSARR